MLIEGVSLAGLKAKLSKQVDDQAEAIRASIITLGAGQAMVYEQKQREAEAFTANPDIDPALVPHVASEAALRGISNADMAGLILASAAEWTAVSVGIELLRIGAKNAIEAAATPSEARAVARVDWANITN